MIILFVEFLTVMDTTKVVIQKYNTLDLEHTVFPNWMGYSLIYFDYFFCNYLAQKSYSLKSVSIWFYIGLKPLFPELIRCLLLNVLTQSKETNRLIILPPK